MNIFNIIGPIMIGPSSSHTAGVVRIGLISYNIFGHTPSDIEIIFYGSFAKTYVGHGSDKAIIGGLLGMGTSDDTIRDSLKIAKEKGVNFKFKPSDVIKSHPNTVEVIGKSVKGEIIRIVGISIGGGNIVIKKINDLAVELDGNFDTILINHIDKSGVVRNVTTVLYENKINIANMKVYRTEKGGNAMMIIESDERLDENIIKDITTIDNIKNAVIIPKIEI